MISHNRGLIVKGTSYITASTADGIKCLNQLLQLCTARTARSESDQTVRTVHSCNSWWLALLWSDSVIKLVSVLFGKCTTLVVTKCWPMVIRQPSGDQWKAEKLGAFWRWPMTRCLIKSDSSQLNYRAHCKFCLIRQQSRAVQYDSFATKTQLYGRIEVLKSPPKYGCSKLKIPSSSSRWSQQENV